MAKIWTLIKYSSPMLKGSAPKGALLFVFLRIFVKNSIYLFPSHASKLIGEKVLIAYIFSDEKMLSIYIFSI